MSLCPAASLVLRPSVSSCLSAALCRCTVFLCSPHTWDIYICNIICVYVLIYWEKPVSWISNISKKTLSSLFFRLCSHDSLPGREPHGVLPGSNASGCGHLQEQRAGGKIFLVGMRPWHRSQASASFIQTVTVSKDAAVWRALTLLREKIPNIKHWDPSWT